MRLFRVVPYLQSVRSGEPGHPLYLPERQGSGRVDNPEHYQVLYASDVVEGALAEAFGTLTHWGSGMLRGSPALPGSIRALAEYDAPDGSVCDLDDANELVRWELRPSQVVTRDRSVTQRWSLRLWESGSWTGVRWWSYYDSRWGSHGLWDITSVEVRSVHPLSIDDEALHVAAGILARVIEP